MEGLPSFITGILALLLFTAFTKIFTACTILRQGLGLKGTGFGAIIAAFAFALSLFVVSPQVNAAGGIDQLLRSSSWDSVEPHFRPFLEKNVDTSVRERFRALDRKIHGEQKEVSRDPFPLLLISFLVSELKAAFQIGFMLLVPFLVLDLAITNVLMLLGVTQVPVEAIALPLKILLFFSVNGWQLLAEKLVGGYVY
jgi:flagellar biosynthesis protein FliP